MNIGTTQFATGVAIKVFDEFLKELQLKKSLNHLLIEKPFHIIEGNDDFVVTGHAVGEMEPPVFAFHQKPNGQQYTRLDIAGTISLWVSSPTAESPPLFTFNVSASLLVSIVLKPRPGQAPLIGLRYDGIESYTGPINQEQLEELIVDQNLLTVIDSMNLDLVTPLIEGIETIYGPQPDGTVFSHDVYPVGLKLMKGNDEHVDAFGVLVDIPINDGMPDIVDSFVPNGCEIMFYTSPQIMDVLLSRGRQTLSDYLAGYKEHISVKRLSITAQSNFIYLDGKIEDSYLGAAEGTIKGPVYFQLFPGSKNIYLNFHEVEIEIDLPWWADVIVFFAGESDTVEGIPDMAQQKIIEITNNMMRNLASSLDLEGLDVEGVPVVVYPDRLKLDNGALSLYLQILISPITEKLERADYGKLRRKFMIFNLESGRRFATKDLAKFMRQGLVTVPHFHEVGEEYIRANPDEDKGNNLFEQWGRT